MLKNFSGTNNLPLWHLFFSFCLPLREVVYATALSLVTDISAMGGKLQVVILILKDTAWRHSLCVHPSRKKL